MMANTRESETIEATGHGELSQLPPLTSAFEALKEAYDAEDAFFRLKTWSLSQSALCASADQIEHELFGRGWHLGHATGFRMPLIPVALENWVAVAKITGHITPLFCSI